MTDSINDRCVGQCLSHKGDLLRGLRSGSFAGGEAEKQAKEAAAAPRRRSRRGSTMAAIDEQLGEKRTEVTRALLEVIPKVPVPFIVRFSDLGLTLKASGKTILDGVTGEIRPYELTAVPVKIFAEHFFKIERRCSAQLRPGSSSLLSAPRFLDRVR